jgi:hypothetical protein
VERRQAEQLRALAAGRPVFLYAPELGIQVRLADGIDRAAPFFKPWLASCRLAYVSGDIGIKTPLLELLQADMADSIMARLRSASCPRLPGILWPHGVLVFPPDGRSPEAEQYLDGVWARGPSTSRQYLEAACYWSRFPGRLAKVRECLEKAHPADPHTATGWGRFCNDLYTASRLMESYTLPLQNSDPCNRAIHLQRGDFWARVFGHVPSARIALNRADLSEASDGVSSLFQFAMAWAGLLDESEHALWLANKAMTRQYESGIAGALWWRCFRDDKGRAEDCLTMPHLGPVTPGGTLMQIEHMMIHGLPPDQARHMLRRIDWTTMDPELTVSPMCREARLWWFLFGDADSCKAALSRAIDAGKETSDFLDIAEACLDMACLSADDQFRACREMLHLAQAKAGDAIDYVFCAGKWVELLGDDNQGADCLIKAETREPDEEDFVSISNGWTELIERSAWGGATANRFHRHVLRKTTSIP